MKKILVLVCIIAITASGCANLQQVLGTAGDIMNGNSVSTEEIISGLKSALEIGLGKGADNVSKVDGFFKNEAIKILFPKEAQVVENTLRDIGLGKEVDKVVLSLNRGAEDAAKQAKPIFLSAIKQMTITDAMGILKGKDNEATDFLKRTTTSQLQAAFKPVIAKSLDKVQATKYWDDIIVQYNKVPMVKKINTDLNQYVTEKAMEGLFSMIAKEEKTIRKDPLARTTDLLKRVFKIQDPGGSNTGSTTHKTGGVKPSKTGTKTNTGTTPNTKGRVKATPKN